MGDDCVVMSGDDLLLANRLIMVTCGDDGDDSWVTLRSVITILDLIVVITFLLVITRGNLATVITLSDDDGERSAGGYGEVSCGCVCGCVRVCVCITSSSVNLMSSGIGKLRCVLGGCVRVCAGGGRSVVEGRVLVEDVVCGDEWW